MTSTHMSSRMMVPVDGNLISDMKWSIGDVMIRVISNHSVFFCVKQCEPVKGACITSFIVAKKLTGHAAYSA